MAEVKKEIPSGYKRSEVGLVPNDWNVVELSSLVDKDRKIRYGIVQPGKYDPQGRYMVRGQDYSFGWTNPENLFKVSPNVEERYKNARLQEGDIIVTIVGASTGQVEIVPGWLDGANITQTTARIAIDADKAVNVFCKYLLLGKYGKLQVSNFIKGGAQPGLNICDIEKFLLPVPSDKTEQTAIANVLSDTDMLIKKLEKLIQKKKAIKQGAMQELLTGKRRLPGFGGEWDEKELKNIAKYRRGSFPQPYGLSKWYDEFLGKPFVQVYDVDGNMKLKSETKRRISKEAEQMSVFVKERSIVLTIQGSIGRIAITQYDAYVDRTLLIFESFLVPVDKIYFAYSVFSLFEKEKQKAPGGIIKTITKERLSSFLLPLPSKPEQAAIAQVLSDMDSEIDKLEQKLAKYKMLKQGMMQVLLTGKIRLV